MIAARTVSDANVVDVVRDLAWATDERTGLRKLTPEGLYGRHKRTALIRRRRLPEASAGSVDRAMRTLGLSGVRRDKGVRTTIAAKDGKRAGDLLDRDLKATSGSLRTRQYDVRRGRGFDGDQQLGAFVPWRTVVREDSVVRSLGVAGRAGRRTLVGFVVVGPGSSVVPVSL